MAHNGTPRAGQAGTFRVEQVELAELGNALISQVRTYWHSLRQGHQIPDRSQFDARAISGAARHTFILEHVRPGVARIRVAGGHLSDLMGMDVRGMPITALVEPLSRPRLTRIVDQLVDVPATGLIDLRRGALTARLLLLPLRSETGKTDKVLGCLASFGSAAAPPCRFDVAGDTVTPLVAVDAQANRPALTGPRGFAGLGEPPAPFDRAEPQGRPSYLRLVKIKGPT